MFHPRSRIFGVLGFLTLISLTTIAQAKTFAPPGAGFSVNMPGKPQHSQEIHKSFVGSVDENSYTVNSGGTTYTASVSDLPGAAIALGGAGTILGKAKDGELHLVTGFAAETKTKSMIAMLKALGCIKAAGDASVIVVTDGIKQNVYKSARNIERVHCIPAAELNARQALLHKHVVFEASAFERLNAPVAHVKRSRKPKGTRRIDQATIKGAESAKAEG